MSRPNTLAEVSRLINEGTPLRKAMPEFLDQFYSDDRKEVMLSRLIHEPELTSSEKLDAYFAGVAEYLSKQNRLNAVPSWVGGASRFLGDPWFATAIDTPEMREYLTFSSPAEFKNHGVFTDEAPLRRASQKKSSLALSDAVKTKVESGYR